MKMLGRIFLTMAVICLFAYLLLNLIGGGIGGMIFIVMLHIVLVPIEIVLLAKFFKGTGYCLVMRGLIAFVLMVCVFGVLFRGREWIVLIQLAPFIIPIVVELIPLDKE